MEDEILKIAPYLTPDRVRLAEICIVISNKPKLYWWSETKQQPSFTHLNERRSCCGNCYITHPAVSLIRCNRDDIANVVLTLSTTSWGMIPCACIRTALSKNRSLAVRLWHSHAGFPYTLIYYFVRVFDSILKKGGKESYKAKYLRYELYRFATSQQYQSTLLMLAPKLFNKFLHNFGHDMKFDETIISRVFTSLESLWESSQLIKYVLPNLMCIIQRTPQISEYIQNNVDTVYEIIYSIHNNNRQQCMQVIVESGGNPYFRDAIGRSIYYIAKHQSYWVHEGNHPYYETIASYGGTSFPNLMNYVDQLPQIWKPIWFNSYPYLFKRDVKMLLLINNRYKSEGKTSIHRGVMHIVFHYMLQNHPMKHCLDNFMSQCIEGYMGIYTLDFMKTIISRNDLGTKSHPKSVLIVRFVRAAIPKMFDTIGYDAFHELMELIDSKLPSQCYNSSNVTTINGFYGDSKLCEVFKTYLSIEKLETYLNTPQKSVKRRK